MALPDQERWEAPESAQTVLSTELNALANGGLSGNSSTQDQDATGYTRADFELLVDFVSAPSAGANVRLFILPLFDGTNVALSDILLTSHFAGAFAVSTTTAEQRIVLRGVEVPPVDFQCAVYNDTGQAFPATGSTLRMRRYSAEIEE